MVVYRHRESLVVPCVYIEDGVREGVWQPVVSVSDDAFLRQYLRKYYPGMSTSEYNEVKSYIQDASNLEVIKETTFPTSAIASVHSAEACLASIRSLFVSL